MNVPAGGHHIQAFFQTQAEPHPQVLDAGWSGDVTGWTDDQVTGLLRAVVQDYLADFGQGHQWADVAFQAAFMLSALYSDDVRSERRQAWTFYLSPWEGEGFEVRLSLSRQQHIPPVPTLSGAGASEVQLVPESVFANSVARLPGLADPLQASAADVARWFREVVQQLGLTDARAVQVAGALLALWRAAQVTGLVTGGSLYKKLRRPDLPEEAAHAVRLKFKRTGEAAEAALEQAVDGGAFLLH